MTIKDVIIKISDEQLTDIFMLSGDISDATADELINEIKEKKRDVDSCTLILTTYGGDPDAGFRIIRYIKRNYKKLILYVFGTCKSTGTLMALGADEIVMSDFGEFGPLDIQLTKGDELINTSGLSYLQSLIALNEQLYSSFEKNFMSLKRTTGFTIATRTAAEIASKLAIGIISPISGQIDPLKLGEVNRAIRIADDYGRRLLGDKTDNDVISKLIGDYPSHGFVIDFEEAKIIFKDTIQVRFVNEDETILVQNLSHVLRRQASKTSIFALTNLFKPKEVNENQSSEEQQIENSAVAQPQNIQNDEDSQSNTGTEQEGEPFEE